VTFAEYFVVLQRRWRVWASMLLAGVFVAGLASALAPVKYTAVATSFVTVVDSSSDDQSAIFQGSQFAVQRVKSYSSLVRSPSVIDTVITELGLEISSQELSEQIVVSSPPETVLMEVSVVDPDPTRATEIANAVSRQLGVVIEELETGRGPASSSVKVSLTQPAAVPRYPSSPRVVVNLLLGALAGLTLGFLAAVLRHHFDRRIKSHDDLRNVAGISPLGSIPLEPSSDEQPLVALDWRSVSAEGYRTVRTALKFAAVDSNLKHFAVSSALAGEGKTSTACNLAISWAQSGASVCLVEADLRRPKVADYFGIEGGVGLSEVLVGELPLDEVLVPWNREMLTVLPAGSLPPDPSALLGSDAMRALVQRLASKFDVVIYDSPPLLPVPDAVVLGTELDGLVLAVRCGSTTPELVSECIGLTKDSRVTLLGGVLTFARWSRPAKRHRYESRFSSQRPEMSPLVARAARADSAEKPASAEYAGTEHKVR